MLNIDVSKDRFIGTVLDGRYEISEIIGEGGMAVVYKAMCNRLNRYVAVKIMRDEMSGDEEFRRRFCAESQAVAMLSHHNIVSVYDVSHNDNLEYIVMELVDGITLKQYLNRKGAVGWKETLHFSRQIAKALEHAHARGIIHRDIKPQNIMLLRDGTIKVADFGIAALENEIHEASGQAVGSVHYIAPEQARGELPDARSDIYSLGVVMYEMISGKLPFTGESLKEIALKHINSVPELPHDIVDNVPPELERIIFKCMNPNVSARYQSASELVAELDNFYSLQKESEENTETTAPAVAPVRSSSEMSSSGFKLRRRRSRKVSFCSGVFYTLLVSVFLFGFLWKFWLADLFKESASFDVPDFTGLTVEEVLDNKLYSSTYNFIVSYIENPESEPGKIISQSPAAGKTLAESQYLVDIYLTANSENVYLTVPECSNENYIASMEKLANLGFSVEVSNSTSDSVSKDLVISSNPSSGEYALYGSVITLTVSTGPVLETVEMPNLIGLSSDAAIAKIREANLIYGGSQVINNDARADIVISQSVEAFSQTEEHTKIVIVVSAGPEE